MGNQHRTAFAALFLALAFIVNCGGGDETATADFDLTNSTLEVETVAQGLNNPAGIAVDFDATDFKDNIFVAELGTGKVLAIDEEGNVTPIIGDNLSAPSALFFAIQPDSLWVANSQSNKLSFVDFSQTPAVGTTYATLPQGVFPQSITSDGSFLYVSARNSTQANKDAIYIANTLSPVLLAEGFQKVGGIAHRQDDDRSELLVVDTKAGTVSVLEIDEDNDEVQTDFDTLLEDLKNPTDIAIGPGTEFIYICEAGADRIIRATADGSKTETVAKIASPSGMAFDAKGVLYVSSSEDGKVFRIKGLKETVN